MITDKSNRSKLVKKMRAAAIAGDSKQVLDTFLAFAIDHMGSDEFVSKLTPRLIIEILMCKVQLAKLESKAIGLDEETNKEVKDWLDIC